MKQVLPPGRVALSAPKTGMGGSSAPLFTGAAASVRYPAAMIASGSGTPGFSASRCGQVLAAAPALGAEQLSPPRGCRWVWPPEALRSRALNEWAQPFLWPVDLQALELIVLGRGSRCAEAGGPECLGQRLRPRYAARPSLFKLMQDRELRVGAHADCRISKNF